MEYIRTDEITGLWSYLKTIDFTDPWFAGLWMFHVLCALTTCLTCGHTTLQGSVFAFYLVLVGCSEYINEFAAEHWKKFSRQQYFDSNGLFISVVFSVPVLINCLVIVVLWLKTSADLMRNIRQKQLQRQARKEGEATSAANTDKGETTAELSGGDPTSADPTSADPTSADSKKDQ